MKISSRFSGGKLFFFFLLIGIFAGYAWAETVELVTYYPTSSNIGDLHTTSLTVGNNYLNTVPANGQALIQTSLGIGPGFAAGAPNLLRVQGVANQNDSVVFLPGAGGTLAVGIGAAGAAGTELTVSNNATVANPNADFFVDRTGANPSTAMVSAQSDLVVMGSLSNDPLALATNNTTRVMIQADGRVQVGASSLFVQNDQGGNIELGGTSTVANSVANGTPYIDFHFGTGAAQDYNARIINSANNRLSLFTSADTVNPAFTVNGTRIGIGTAAPQAALEINSTTSGFLPPRMTTGQKNAIAAPQQGMLVYDTTLQALQIYDGFSWGSNGLSGGGSTLISAEVAYKGTTATSVTFSKPADARYAVVKVMGGANGANISGSHEDNEFMNVLIDFTANRSTGTHMWVGGNGNSYMFNYGWRNSPLGARVTAAVGETIVGAYNAVTLPRIDATATTVTFSFLSANTWDQSYWVLYYR